MALSPEKSLGEKLSDAILSRHGHSEAWASMDARERANFEAIGLAFAASLSHDEQTQAARAEGFAQGRASLEERVRLLEDGLRGIDGACSSFCDCDGDFVAGQVQTRISALLAIPGERENGDA